MIRFQKVLLAVCALGALVSCQSSIPIAGLPYAPDSGTLAVRCGRLIDGLSDEVASDVTVMIENGRITAIGRDIAVPPGARVLDLSDFTVLPGLIDMHTHVTDGSDGNYDLHAAYTTTAEEQLARGRGYAVATLMAGFTSVRNVGVYRGFIDRDLRDEINAGVAIGPRMQISGFYLTIPGGGGDLVIPGIPEQEIPPALRMGVSRGPEEFRRNAQTAIDGGADLLKVIASGAVLAYGGIPGEPEMTPDELSAVAEVAHAAGKKLAAHAHGARSVKEAILAGADTIEHASLIDEEGIRLAKERDVALAMDVYNGDYIDTEGRRLGWPQEFLDKNLATVDEQRRAFQLAYRIGAPIVYATDSGVYPHGDNAKQFRIMVGLGMKPMDAIRSATSVAAHYMGWADRIGALEPGRYGDLIAVRGDPLTEIAVLEHVEAVIKGGLVFKRPAELR